MDNAVPSSSRAGFLYTIAASAVALLLLTALAFTSGGNLDFMRVPSAAQPEVTAVPEPLLRDSPTARSVSQLPPPPLQSPSMPPPPPSPPLPPPCAWAAGLTNLRALEQPLWCFARNNDAAACELAFVSFEDGGPGSERYRRCEFVAGECAAAADEFICPSPPRPPPLPPPPPPFPPPPPSPPIFRTTGALTADVCHAMMRDPSHKFWSMWAGWSFGTRKKGAAGCWADYGGRDYFERMKWGQGCDRSWMLGGPHFSAPAPALLGFDQAILEFCLQKMGRWHKVWICIHMYLCIYVHIFTVCI